MSFSGQSPTVKRTRYTPQSTDPVNPTDGDFFYSDGTLRAEGPWVYLNGAWTQVSTSDALTVVNNITYTPQSTTPTVSAPDDIGMMFYSDGTSRAEGLWIYTDEGWEQVTGLRYQEFYYKNYLNVRLATTASEANININVKLRTGQSIDGVALAKDDYVLVKNQTTNPSQNGIYKVLESTSGDQVDRVPEANTYSELNDCSVWVSSGTVNTNTIWLQNSTLISLSDNQTWSNTESWTKTFTVPADVYELTILGAGGGGAGGTGGGSGAAAGGGGGAGGNGAMPHLTKVTVSPGDVLQVKVGLGGRGVAATSIGQNGGQGGTGGTSTVVLASNTAYFYGGVGGLGGLFGDDGNGGAGGGGVANNGAIQVGGGDGGFRTNIIAGADGYSSPYGAGGVKGTYVNTGGSRYAGVGGGGGAGIKGTGGAGAQNGKGNESNNRTLANGPAGGNATGCAAGGGGGGGGGGMPGTRSYGGTGGYGSCGYIRISWA